MHRTSFSLILVVNKVSVMWIYNAYVFSGLNAAKGEIGTLKALLKEEKIQKTQGRLLQLYFL